MYKYGTHREHATRTTGGQNTKKRRYPK